MRPRIAKIGENAVAHVFRDKPIEPGHSLGDGTVISADDFAQILGIEACGEFGRADQIQDHTGELAPLRATGKSWWRRCCRLWSGGPPDWLAAAATEPRRSLVIKATCRTWNRQR